MAYTHSKYEVPCLATDGTRLDSATAGTGTKGRWAPGYVPHIVRSVSVKVAGTGVLSNPMTISFRKQAFGASPTGGTVVGIVTLPTTGSLDSKVYYKHKLDSEISVGQDLAAYITSTGATTGPNIEASAYVEPRWDVPGNDTDMVETA